MIREITTKGTWNEHSPSVFSLDVKYQRFACGERCFVIGWCKNQLSESIHHGCRTHPIAVRAHKFYGPLPKQAALQTNWRLTSKLVPPAVLFCIVWRSERQRSWQPAIFELAPVPSQFLPLCDYTAVYHIAYIFSQIYWTLYGNERYKLEAMLHIPN